jgi:rRNA processing protein Gar1
LNLYLFGGIQGRNKGKESQTYYFKRRKIKMKKRRKRRERKEFKGKLKGKE